MPRPTCARCGSGNLYQVTDPLERANNPQNTDLCGPCTWIELQRLRAENERMREALRPFRRAVDNSECFDASDRYWMRNQHQGVSAHHSMGAENVGVGVTLNDIRRAAEALGEDGAKDE